MIFSESILNFLYDHIARSADLQARVHWSPNTVVLWDNRITAHVSAIPQAIISTLIICCRVPLLITGKSCQRTGVMALGSLLKLNVPFPLGMDSSSK